MRFPDFLADRSIERFFLRIVGLNDAIQFYDTIASFN